MSLIIYNLIRKVYRSECPVTGGTAVEMRVRFLNGYTVARIGNIFEHIFPTSFVHGKSDRYHDLQNHAIFHSDC